MIPANICIVCMRYRDGKKCEAYPNGIPQAIWMGEHDHREPYPGDNGIRFEPASERIGAGQ